MSLRGNGGSPVMIGRAVNDGDVAAAAAAEEGEARGITPSLKNDIKLPRR